MSSIDQETKVETKTVTFILPEGHRSRSSSEQTIYIPKKLSRSSTRSSTYKRSQVRSDVYNGTVFAISGFVLPTGIPNTKHILVEEEEECKCLVM